MLTNDDLSRAKNELHDHPTYLQLLDTIWPVIKNFDFSEKNKLTIPMPKHRPPRLENQEFVSESEYEPYSHRALKTVLECFKLKPIRVGDNTRIIIASKK